MQLNVIKRRLEICRGESNPAAQKTEKTNNMLKILHVEVNINAWSHLVTLYFIIILQHASHSGWDQTKPIHLNLVHKGRSFVITMVT